jgi:hypothetical protein
MLSSISSARVFGAEDGAPPEMLSSISSASHTFGAEDGAFEA